MRNMKPKMPPLIYGTAWKKERTAELVEKAIMHGFRGIDTACQPKHYHEAGVGEALKKLEVQGIPRHWLYIQTKFTPLAGQDSTKIPYDPSAPLSLQVHQSFNASLQNLQLDFIDGLLLHSPLPYHDQTMLAWRAMEELHQQGKVGLLGISNCYELNDFKRIYDEASIKPGILQNRFYRDTGYDELLRRFCLENAISYQGFWTLTANTDILSHPLIRQLATFKGVAEGPLFYRFLTQFKIIPLIGTCTEKHIQEDLTIFDWSLTQEEMAQISALLFYHT